MVWSCILKGLWFTLHQQVDKESLFLRELTGSAARSDTRRTFAKSCVPYHLLIYIEQIVKCIQEKSNE